MKMLQTFSSLNLVLFQLIVHVAFVPAYYHGIPANAIEINVMKLKTSILFVNQYFENKCSFVKRFFAGGY